MQNYCIKMKKNCNVFGIKLKELLTWWDFLKNKKEKKSNICVLVCCWGCCMLLFFCLLFLFVCPGVFVFIFLFFTSISAHKLCRSFCTPQPPLEDHCDGSFRQSLDHVPCLKSSHVLQTYSLDLQHFISTLQTTLLCRSPWNIQKTFFLITVQILRLLLFFLESNSFFPQNKLRKKHLWLRFCEYCQLRERTCKDPVDD